MPYEGKVGQTFTLDLDLSIDLSAAARSDKVADTVSYDKVAACAAQVFCTQRFRLIEAAAGQRGRRIARRLPAVRKVKVTIHKPHAPIAATFSDVGVTLERARARFQVMTEALLALGGNVGDSRVILDRAVKLLCDGNDIRLTARSSDYRTPPWGFKYQPPFINLCIAVETRLSPRDLLARAQAVELKLGRDRAHEKRWGPRTADIDIISL